MSASQNEEQEQGTRHTWVPCSTCGTPVRRYLSQIERSENAYCNAACYKNAPKRSYKKKRSDTDTERSEYVEVPCVACGKMVRRRASDVRRMVYCSRSCYQSQPFIGPGRPVTTPIGSEYVGNQGYMLVYVGRDYPGASSKGYIGEHRKVMAEHLDRKLESFENVHHKNGDKLDNRLENLELWVTKQPKGQRVEDVVAYSVEMLQRYAPEMLAA